MVAKFQGHDSRKIICLIINLDDWGRNTMLLILLMYLFT